MPIETATFISDLNVSFPQHGDGIAEADTHMRLIKSTLKNTFPNISAAVTPSHTDLNNGFVPIGCILLWSGSVATIPANWALCNGATHGSVTTPDLRNRFILAAGDIFNPGDFGGAASYVVTTAADGAHTHTGVTGLSGGHNHAAASTATSTATSTAVSTATSTATSSASSSGSVSGTVAGHVLEIGEIPAHDHGLSGLQILYFGGPGGHVIDSGGGLGASTVFPFTNGGNVAHAHDWSGTATVTTSVSTSVSTLVNTSVSTAVGTTVSTTNVAAGDHQHSIDSTGSTHSHSLVTSSVPVFYALAYIMRVT